MSAAEVLKAARAAGIELGVDGNYLVLEARAHRALNVRGSKLRHGATDVPTASLKAPRSYTIDEVARTLEVHRNTVRHWIKAGLPVIDGKRPVLMLGADLVEFLLQRRDARRQPCRAGQMFCLKCRKPQEPGGPDGGLRGEFCHLGRPHRHMPRLQSSDVSTSVGRAIVRVRGRTRRLPDAGTAT